MLMSEMSWEVQQGKCTRVNAYQRNDGTPVANVDIADPAYFTRSWWCRCAKGKRRSILIREAQPDKADAPVGTRPQG